MYGALNFYIKQVYYAYTQLLICICITLEWNFMAYKSIFYVPICRVAFYLLYVYILYILFKRAIITI